MDINKRTMEWDPNDGYVNMNGIRAFDPMPNANRSLTGYVSANDNNQRLSFISDKPETLF